MLTPTETNLLILMTFVIMFGLGCTLSIRDFREAIRHPKPAIVGFLSQYLIMPALAFGMVKFFRFSDPVAIGLIIVACCPSGTTSSLFNYFAKGDLALHQLAWLLDCRVAGAVAAAIGRRWGRARAHGGNDTAPAGR